MNFLAHLYLSGNNEKIKVGNFIGDFVKGNQLSDFEEEIKKGILLHRAIDQYTDSHPIVFESKKRLRPTYRHYSPVIVDVFYDHFLAKKWATFSDIGLEKYTFECYDIIKKYQNVIPEGVNEMLTYMSSKNWLYNYQFVEGIDHSLKGMARRTKFDSKMEHAANSLMENYQSFEREFDQFFPELEIHVKQMLK